MDVILIPGLWLSGSSWELVTPVLAGAGHRPRPITLPGMESPDADRSAISLEEAIAAVTEAVDESTGEVVLVGHSAGGGVAHAVVDARPDRIARVLYVGGFPIPTGEPIAGGFPTEGGEIVLPGWDAFEDPDLADMDEQMLRAFRDRAIASPGRFATDPQRLTDDRRYDVPVTIVCTEFSSGLLQEWVEQGLDPVREIPRLRHVEYVDLPTGHWPQFTRPADLGRIIADRASRPHIDEHHRIHPPADANETLTALGFLDYQRATLAWKVRGLDGRQLAQTTAASSLTLGGILKHMAVVEELWFSRSLHDLPWRDPWRSVDWDAAPDWEFRSAAADSPDDLHRLWRTATDRSRALAAAALARGGLDVPAAQTGDDGEAITLRWIVLHMIEEYARHNGHADLLRESIDGETGE
jgi:pimeloyl-ACP methyl ester carboxylesterase/uncharacterized damage-inducible protein DinB